MSCHTLFNVLILTMFAAGSLRVSFSTRALLRRWSTSRGLEHGTCLFDGVSGGLCVELNYKIDSRTSRVALGVSNAL